MQTRPYAGLALAVTLLCVHAVGARADGSGAVNGEGRFQQKLSARQTIEWQATSKLAIDGQNGASGTVELSRISKTDPMKCRYTRFERAVVMVNQGRFRGIGQCTTTTSGRSTTSASSADILIIDHARIRGTDEIEVRLVGAPPLTTKPVKLLKGDFTVVPGATAAERQARSMDQLSQASLVYEGDKLVTVPDIVYHGAFPAQVLVDVLVEGPDPVARAASYLARYRSAYRIDDPDLGFGVRRHVRDDRPRSATTDLPDSRTPGDVVHFYQTWKGIPVAGADIAVFLKDEEIPQGDTNLTLIQHKVVGTTGNLLLPPVRLDPLPRITAAQAELAVVAAFAREVPPATEDGTSPPPSPAPELLGQTLLTVYDAGLGQSAVRSIFDVKREPRLAWRVSLRAADNWEVYVDAHSADPTQPVELARLRRDAPDISIDLERVQATTPPTNAMNSGCYIFSTADDDIGDEDGIDFGDTDDADGDGMAAVNNFKATYNFYLNRYARESFDADDGEMEVYINAGLDFPNAAFVDCGVDYVFDFYDKYPIPDIVAHEFGHGVNRYGADFWDAIEPRTMNESLADLMAHMQYPDDAILGSDTIRVRFLDNPGRKLYWDPELNDTDGDGFADNGTDPDPDDGSIDPDERQPYPDHWNARYTGKLDDFGRHINTGPTNNALYLFIEGGKHRSTGVDLVEPLGEEANRRSDALAAARRFVYRATQAMPSGSGPGDMRATMMAASVQAGDPPWLTCLLRRAFRLTGIGQAEWCEGPPADPDWDNVPTDESTEWREEEVFDETGGGIRKEMVKYTIPGDNCPQMPNPDQANMDGDTDGDVCDPDIDGDGRPQGKPWPDGDNCPEDYNPSQSDLNFNGIGTPCDPAEDGDLDDDTVKDNKDNCPWDYNTAQTDTDADGEGDACDPDHDGDGISNDQDNCIGVVNGDQVDKDGDGLGDACDKCPEAADSSVAIGYWQDPITGKTTFKTQVPDSDGDGQPDACDAEPDTAYPRAHPALVCAGREGGSCTLAAPVGAISLLPDGRARYVSVTGQLGEVASIRLPLCSGRECAGGPAPNSCLSYDIGGLGADLHAYITDDRGRNMGSAPRPDSPRVIAVGSSDATSDDTRTVRLQPRGGITYSLNLLLLGNVTGKVLGITPTTCTVGDRAPDPTIAQ